MNGEPHHVKLYNLPQRVEGGIKIHGYANEQGEKQVLLYDHLDGMFANLKVEGVGEIVHLQAATPLVELGNGEYEIETIVEEDEDKSY